MIRELMALPEAGLKRLFAFLLLVVLTVMPVAAEERGNPKSSDLGSQVGPLRQGVTEERLFAELLAHNALRSAALLEYVAMRTYAVSDLKGKVYLINFWATDCDTCIKEMPQMVDTYNRFKDRGLEFVAVAMKYDAPMYVVNYAQTRQLPFKVAMDDGSAAAQFGNVELTPTTFVVDKNGTILKRYVGEPKFSELDQLLKKALGA